jgi:peptidoglycan/LPS O-acetylase OafA/YrhL
VSSAAGSRTLHTLDALRGVAACAVIVFHYPRWLAPLSVSSGYLAVDLFFILSGIVIARSYDVRFANGMSTAQFLSTRLIRLYPLYALGAFLGLTFRLASVLAHAQHFDLQELAITAALSAFFIPSFAGRDAFVLFPLDFPAWSLFWELIVNMLFAFTWRRLTGARLVAVSMLSAAGLFVLVIAQGDANGGFSTATLLMGFTRATFGFSLGVLLARYVVERERRRSAVAFVILCVATVILLAGSTEHRAIHDTCCIFLLFPLTAYLAMRLEPPALLQPVATFLGVSSYALYLLSAPILSAVNVVLPRLSVRPGMPLSITLFASLLAICWLIDRRYDAPVRRYLSERLTRLRPASVHAARP